MPSINFLCPVLPEGTSPLVNWYHNTMADRPKDAFFSISPTIDNDEIPALEAINKIKEIVSTNQPANWWQPLVPAAKIVLKMPSFQLVINSSYVRELIVVGYENFDDLPTWEMLVSVAVWGARVHIHNITLTDTLMALNQFVHAQQIHITRNTFDDAVQQSLYSTLYKDAKAVLDITLKNLPGVLDGLTKDATL